MAGQTQTPPPVDDDDEINTLACAIAEEFSAPVAKASEAIRHLLSGPIFLGPQQQRSASPRIVLVGGVPERVNDFETLAGRI